jgi:hypothetical protein
MDLPTSDFVRAFSLAELRAKGRLVLHGRHSPILVVYDGGRIFALDRAHSGRPGGRPSSADAARPLDFTCKLNPYHQAAPRPRSAARHPRDAAQFIADLEPFRQVRPVWDRAAEMILIAASTGRKTDVQEATRQVLYENMNRECRGYVRKRLF